MADPSDHDSIFDPAVAVIQRGLPKGEQVRCVAMVIVTTEGAKTFSVALDATKEQALQMLGSMDLLHAELLDTLRPPKIMFGGSA